MSKKKEITVSVVGHPYAPIGMGEHARSVFRACQTARLKTTMVDIYKMYDQPDISFQKGISAHYSELIGDGVNIFCINGDEVENSLKALEKRGAGRGYNIIYPAWELAKYPKEWAEQLDRFDEIWAPSQFIKDSIEPVVNKPVVHMPLACEVSDITNCTRRYFGIPESSYAFLFAFDFLSYRERKNPEAVIDAFRIFCERNPNEDAVLVIKTNNGEKKKDAYESFLNKIGKIKYQVVVINETLSDADMKALLYLCDCFVSMHRSEGFGRGLAEAMYLGKPVIATGYSGNMDFCDGNTSFILEYELIPVNPGEYPFWQDQEWANASVEHCCDLMEKLVKEPDIGRLKGALGRAKIYSDLSYQAIGLRYLDRIRYLKEKIDSKKVESEVR